MNHLIIGTGPAGVIAAETLKKHAPDSNVTLIGDEPEPLVVVPWPIDRLYELCHDEGCSEGRTIAALYMVREYLARRGRCLTIQSREQ
jgi:hypothetical protein